LGEETLAKARAFGMGNENGGFLPNSLKFEEENANYVPLEHTYFAEENKRALSLLIILFERYLLWS